MSGAAAVASEEWAPPVFEFISDAQALAHFDSEHKIVLLGGGVGSGKTVLHGLDALKRSKHETDLLHGIFTNTETQRDKEVVPSIQDRFVAAGFEKPVFDRRPPVSWVRDWVRRGIEVPSVSKHRNVLIAPTGYHAVCGTLHHQSYTQYDTLSFGSARIEEATNVSFAAITTIFERTRCSRGGGERCRKFHRHQKYLIFNPPRGPHPWLYSYLDQLEESARAHYHALRDGEECDCPRVHGPELQHRSWPLLRSGVGSAVWYQSRTSDNPYLDDGYREGLAANMSKDTARRRLDGEIIRETEGGAYTEFSSENIHAGVPYDPDRTLYMWLDFNLEPRAAVFAHQLNPGEYPGEHERSGLIHLGVFGEYFYAGEMSDRRFAQALIRGDRGDGCDSQPRYRSEELRGLPPPCDETCDPVCRKGHWNGLRAHRGRIIACGDQRGTHRSSHGDNLESSWAIVDQEFGQLKRYGKDVPEDQPSPRARVDSVNAKLCNALGVRSLWIHPRCEELIRDFEQVQWDEDGTALREWRRGSMGTEWHRTHLSDGLGYGVHRLSPLGRDVDSKGDSVRAHYRERTKRPSHL
ncbi:MAG TPA: hypothetical protein VNL91_03805 [Thermoanaerobaculia bacterium]|nr:hypothetical protein [Thermoanaerobaculia bacterium]